MTGDFTWMFEVQLTNGIALQAYKRVLGGPGVDGVGGDLDLEHAVGQVLAHERLGEPGAPGRLTQVPLARSPDVRTG